MALRAMYKGFKKVLAPLIINRPGMLAIDQDALNAELNTVFFPRSEQAVLGAKNLLTWWKRYKTGNNIVFTVNNDDTVTVVVGTGGASSTVELLTDEGMPQNYMFLADDLRENPCILSNAGFYDSNIFVEAVYRTSENTFISDERLTNVAEKQLTIPANAYYVRFAVYVKNGTPAGTYTLKPMVRLATDPDNTYAPHAMTNRELTDAVETLNGSASDQKTAINAIIAAATEAADFAAFKTAMGAITPVTRSIQITPETREEITEPVEEVKKTTRKKSTAKAETEKEGE